MTGQQPGREGVPGESVNRQLKIAEPYDLACDIGETAEVSAWHPEILRQLEGEMEKARADLFDTLTERPGSGWRESGQVDRTRHGSIPRFRKRAS